MACRQFPIMVTNQLPDVVKHGTETKQMPMFHCLVNLKLFQFVVQSFDLKRHCNTRLFFLSSDLHHLVTDYSYHTKNFDFESDLSMKLRNAC